MLSKPLDGCDWGTEAVWYGGKTGLYLVANQSMEKKGKRAECTLQSDIFLFLGTFPYFAACFEKVMCACL